MTYRPPPFPSPARHAIGGARPSGDRGRRHSEAKTAREVSEANNAAMGKVLLALKAAGIEQKDIQTSRLSLQPESAPNRPPGPNSIVGYRASNHVTVRLHDVTKIAGTIDMLVGAGRPISAASISRCPTHRSCSTTPAHRRSPDARRKAEIYAKAAGVTLGTPLSISEEGAPGPVTFSQMASACCLADADSAGRRDAAGHGQRFLGDQASGRSTSPRPALRERIGVRAVSANADG